MQTQQQYKICRMCGRLAVSQCSDCACWGFLWLVFAISDIISTAQWELGLYGILGAVFWFLLMMIYCIASCNLREATSRTEYIEIIS